MLDKQKRIDELKSEIKELKILVNRYNAKEKAVKIVLNGGYGCFGNVYFRWYDKTIVEGITATGQVAIKYITNKLNDFINNYAGLDELTDHIPSSDTDSTIGSTILTTDIGKITIEDLYNRYTNESLEMKSAIEAKKDSIRKLTKNIKSASFDGSNIVFNDINYIMKHKVNKRMYKIKSGEKSVVVTEDHSVIVIRNDEMISVKPKDILKSDKLIKIVE